MIGERTSDRDALIQRYDLTARLASRVVALLCKKVDVTAAVLETAAAGPALAAVLLDGLLMDLGAEAMDEVRLQALAAEKGAQEAALLRVVRGEDGWRTIALQDEVLADEVEGAGGGGALTDLALARGEAGVISLTETDAIFTPEEVARLKLTVLTSHNPQERMEALRKLVFAPMPAAQKAGLFVGALVDTAADASVRQEALRGLEQIGFGPELADAMRRLFGEDEEDVLYATERLKALLAEADDAERGVTLAVLLELFAEARDCAVVEKLLERITELAPTLARSPQKTEQLVQSALRQLAREFDGLRLPVERAILGCHRHAGDVVMPILLKEISRSADPRVRSFLVGVAVTVSGDQETLARLAKMALSEIANPGVPEQERSYLRYGLVRLGKPAARAVLELLTRRTSRHGPELIRLLDVLCAEGGVSEGIINEGARFLLETLRAADRETRRLVMDARLCADPRVDEGLRVSLAAELLANLVEYPARDTAETICNSLEGIGPIALRPLFEFLQRRYPHEETEWAFVSIGRIVRSSGQEAPPELMHEILEFCGALFDDPDAPVPAFTLAVAYLCGYTQEGARRFDEFLQTMQERLGKTAYTCELFEALVVMAGSDNARPRHQRELFEVFDRVANTRAPRQLGITRQTQEGTVYEFGREVLFDTRIVPAVVRGLENICVSRAAPPELSKDIVKRLLILWEGVSHARLVWGPGGVGALIHALCAAGCSDRVTVQVRVRLGHSLLRSLKRVAVVRAVGDICGRAARGSEFRDLCLRTAEMMLTEWEGSDKQDDERRLALLVSLGKIAANTVLKAGDPAVERTRENVLQALFVALRGGITGVREPLTMLQECECLPEERRAEIRERLSRAFGLVRREPA